MMEDALDPLDESEDLEEDVQQEVDKVISEIMAGKVSKAPMVPQASIVLPEPSNEDVETEEPEPEAEDDLEEMQSRLQALRS